MMRIRHVATTQGRCQRRMLQKSVFLVRWLPLKKESPKFLSESTEWPVDTGINAKDKSHCRSGRRSFFVVHCSVKLGWRAGLQFGAKRIMQISQKSPTPISRHLLAISHTFGVATFVSLFDMSSAAMRWVWNAVTLVRARMHECTNECINVCRTSSVDTHRILFVVVCSFASCPIRLPHTCFLTHANRKTRNHRSNLGCAHVNGRTARRKRMPSATAVANEFHREYRMNCRPPLWRTLCSLTDVRHQRRVSRELVLFESVWR